MLVIVVVVLLLLIVLLIVVLMRRGMLVMVIMIMLRLLGFWVSLMGCMLPLDYRRGSIGNGRYERRILFFSANILRNSTQDWHLGRNTILGRCMVVMVRLFIMRLHRPR